MLKVYDSKEHQHEYTKTTESALLEHDCTQPKSLNLQLCRRDTFPGLSLSEALSSWVYTKILSIISLQLVNATLKETSVRHKEIHSLN